MRSRASALSGRTLIWRAVTTHRTAVILLAAVIGVGAFLGAAIPRWANDSLDRTLQETVQDAGRKSELSLRSQSRPDAESNDKTLLGLEADADESLGRVLGEGRWAATTSTSQIIEHNGQATMPAESRLQRYTGIWVPDDLTSRVRLIDGQLPSTVTVAPMPESLSDPSAPMTNDLPIIDTVTTPEVAETLRIGIGDTVVFEHGSDNTIGLGGSTLVGARLTGLVEPVDPSDPMWVDAGTALVADPGARGAEPQVMTGRLLSDPSALAALDSLQISLDAEYHFATEPAEFRPDQTDAQIAELRRLGAGSGWQSGLIDVLEDYSAGG